MAQKPTLQLVRSFSALLALALLTASYQFVHATTVAMISRLDIALLIVLGPLIAAQVNGLQRVVALLSFAIFALSAVYFRTPEEQLIGYLMAFAGTVAVTFGYVFLRSSAKDENIYVVTLVPAAAILVYGVVSVLGSSSTALPSASPQTWALGLLSGPVMFFTYHYTVELYKKIDIVLAEYPTLIAAVLTLPLEAWIFSTHFSTAYITFVIGNLLILSLIIALKHPPQFLKGWMHALKSAR